MRIMRITENSFEIFIKHGMSSYSKSVSRSEKNLKSVCNLVELIEA